MKKKPLFLILTLLTLLVPIGFFIGTPSPRQMLLSAVFLLILTVIDFLISPREKARMIAWLALWLGSGGQILLAISPSLGGLQKLTAVLSRFSFIFLILWFFGVAVLIWLLLDKPWFSKAVPVDKRGNFILDFLIRWKLEILIVLVTALSLRTMLASGYFWDDAVNATAYLAEKYDDLPLWRNLLDFMRKYIELGRINLLSCYYYLLFYIEDVRIYKLIIILSVCVNQLLLGMTVRYASGSKKTAQAAMLLIPLLIQFRPYQDPVTGFYALMQVILAELMLTVYFLLRYLREQQPRYLWLSILPFVAGLLTYEVCYPFILMIPLISWLETHDLRKTIRITIPFGIAFAILLAAVFMVRSANIQGQAYAGIAFSLDLPAILRTYGIQLLAALPLSHYLLSSQIAIMGAEYLPANVLPYRASGILLQTQAVEWLIALLMVWIFFMILRSPQQDSGQTRGLNLRLLGGMGLSFWLLPAITIAVSARYQGQLLPGLGYLPVYLEYFGVSLLLVCLTILLFQRIRGQNFRRLAVLFAGCGILVVSALNSQNNRIMIDLLNRAFLFPRMAGEKAIQNGLFDFLPEESKVLSLNPDTYLWEANWGRQGLYPEYYAVQSDKDFQNGSLSADSADPDSLIDKYTSQPVPENLYLLSYDGDREDGLATLGRLRAVDTLNARLITDNVLYFISGEHPEFTDITYQRTDQSLMQITRRDAWQVRNSEQGILYQLPETEEVFFGTFGLAGF